MRIKITIAIGFLLFISTVAFPQQKITISGTVTDSSSKETLVGVNIKVTSTTQGTITDFEGNYTLEVEPPTSLVFSYVGYQEVELAITETSNKQLNVAMQSNTIDINPVVISASRRKEKILDAPAAITVITTKAIASQVSVTTVDLMSNVAGVDVMKTGLQSANVVTRGFNKLFSPNLLTMVDNRLTRIPSLRVNAFQMIPTVDDDIEKIEVLRGPAAVLYGPNSVNGVMHIITKSPIDYTGTKVSWGIGLRSYIPDTLLTPQGNNSRFDSQSVSDRFAMMGSVRHAHKFNIRSQDWQMGYKISAQYFQGNDWKYNDPNEADTIIRGKPSTIGRIEYLEDGTEIPAEQVAAGTRGDYISNQRNENLQRYSVDARLDFRYKNDSELVLASGYNNTSGVVLTPLGALQNDGWGYWYAQTRLRHKRLFAQAFINATNSGNSYYLPTGDFAVEKSRLYAAQLQHSADPLNNWKLIYGFDAFWTRPNTEYTINGSFEDTDNINEYGGYLQSDYKISNKFSLIAATRIDYQSVIKEVFVSPRAAILYKPSQRHTFRATVNRAFETPGTGTLFIDVLQATLPTGINIRGIGSTQEFNFQFDTNPFLGDANLPQFRSPYGETPSTYYNVGDQTINEAAWDGIVNTLLDNVSLILAEDPDLADLADLVNLAVGLILPDTLGNISHEVKDLNLTTRSFVESDWQNLSNINRIQNMRAVTYEVGYKGMLGKNIFVTLDVYRNDYDNYITPTVLITPAVTLSTSDLESYLTPIIQENLANSPSPALNTALINVLDNNPDFGGNGNGQADDEVVKAILDAASQLPVGTITPTLTNGPDMVLASYNIGALSVYGADVSAAMYLSKTCKVHGSYSWIDKDSILVEGAQFGYVALNAPRHKLRIGSEYTWEKYGLDVGAQFRWQAGFPAASGSFVGSVAARHQIDTNINWQPNFNPNLMFTLSVQNVYANTTPHFVGTPQIGRFSVFRIAYNI